MSRYVAVIGGGSFGAKHLEALGRIEGVTPIVVSRRPDRLEELVKLGYGTAPNVASAARIGATACIVATETARHAADSLAAAREGMNVLVEKPMAVDAAEARPVRAAGQPVYVGCLLRFSESLAAFRAKLPRIGRVHHVRIECQSYLPGWRPNRPYRETYSASAAEGGVLRDLIHEIDYAGWIFGWPESIEARLRNLGRLGIASEESADLLWEVADGPEISMTLDYLTRPPRRRMRASGENGTLEWDGFAATVTLSPDGERKEDTELFLENAAQRLVSQDTAFLAEGPADSRLATADDGVRALAICDAARLASASGRIEKVDYR